ncbi:Alcohol dehydrogenase superfamily, zinc-type [Niveomyces insectorum RCEF 264]|uniref:Alcohol dehydrogenase superfamily, zinc-type n=1 Tax=Niveomyces insectorum RCEF 264 TaxID=1081102 RepID=A0A167YTU6_9HYPO|nr:Alcohol dehydrogenase superfamily, zinc-type [Niveomyces insectorum RCEF 264]
MTTETITQAALIGGPNDEIILSTSAPLPEGPLQDSEVAVAVRAIALNPVDTKMTGPFLSRGATLGFDAAGVVTAVGAAASSDEEGGFRVGDRVVVAINGMNSLRPTIGGFAEHTVSWSWGTLKIPDDWTFAQAAGGMGGSAWLTVPWALFYALGLPAGPLLEPLNSRFKPPADLPPKINIVTSHSHSSDNVVKPATAVLVSGGASYTGTCAIQLLKLAGYTVIATCAHRSFDLARSFGADAVFDYASPTCAADIRAHTGNALRLALDCITTDATTRLCYEALGRAGGRYVALDVWSKEVAATRAVVRPSFVVGMEPLGDAIAWPAPFGRPANPVALAFCKAWNRTMQGLVDRGLVRLHPQLVRDTGLAGALQGLDDLRQKRVVGKKLIYTL